MLAQGTPLHVVSEILGHASITITKDVRARVHGINQTLSILDCYLAWGKNCLRWSRAAPRRAG
jgi:hypothetical protein